MGSRHRIDCFYSCFLLQNTEYGILLLRNSENKFFRKFVIYLLSIFLTFSNEARKNALTKHFVTYIICIEGIDLYKKNKLLPNNSNATHLMNERNKDN